MPEIIDILKQAVKFNVSDILIVPNEPPVIRVDGTLQKLAGVDILPAAECKRIIYSMLNKGQQEVFEKVKELDFPYAVEGMGRFRANVYQQQQGVACALRVIVLAIPSPEQIGLSPVILKLTELPKGLVLVTGPTGSGKTTTLAVMLEHINQHSQKHIITIEDPIEFVFKNKSSVIDQREVGQHTTSFSQALKYSLRQNPDIILVGEMRDPETMGLAIRAAETGHLCFSTLHTQNAPSTIDRILSEFPSDQQNKLKLQLTTVLMGVISQSLVPKKGGGRLAAREVMLMNPAIASLIREGKIYQIFSAIESSSHEGMVSMDQALAHYVKLGIVEMAVACDLAHDVRNLKTIISMMVGAPAAPKTTTPVK